MSTGSGDWIEDIRVHYQVEGGGWVELPLAEHTKAFIRLKIKEAEAKSPPKQSSKKGKK